MAKLTLSKIHEITNDLKKLNYTVVTYKDDIVHLKCTNDHEFTQNLFTMNQLSIIRKLKSGEKKYLCRICIVEMPKIEEAQKICEKLDYVYIGFSANTKVEERANILINFICKCGNASTSNFKMFKKKNESSRCLKCLNDPNKKTIEDIADIFAKKNCKLLTTRSEYTNNKMLLRFICPVCDKEGKVVLINFIRGDMCGNPECKLKRTYATNLERYKTENVGASEHTKQKSKETSQKKWKVDHHLKDPGQLAKQQATNKERYNYYHRFEIKTLREMGFNAMMMKYGTQFGLQVEDIQSKIDTVFLKKYNVRRPLMSKEIHDKIKSNNFEKYGNEVFLASNAGKALIKEKYNVDHVMQHPEIYRKAQMNNFRRKPYITPDGIVFMILGYENMALDDLYKENPDLELFAGEDVEIPVFEYYILDRSYPSMYHPDIYIPHIKMVIEVKSTWTYNLDILKIKAKALSVHLPYFYQLRIYNPQRRILEIIQINDRGEPYSLLYNLVILGELIENAKELNKKYMECYDNDNNPDKIKYN